MSINSKGYIHLKEFARNIIESLLYKQQDVSILDFYIRLFLHILLNVVKLDADLFLDMRNWYLCYL